MTPGGCPSKCLNQRPVRRTAGFANGRTVRRFLPALTALLIAGCGGGSESGGEPGGVSGLSDGQWKSAILAGGATTNLEANQSSFGFDSPAGNLLGDSLALHLTGDGEFERAFIKAPSADFPSSDGLGPAFNNNACINCHPRDGRANYNLDTQHAEPGTWTRLGADAGVFLRISIEDGGTCSPAPDNQFCAPKSVPGFSQQLFHRGVFGLRDDSPFSGQADVYVRFDTERFAYPDGTSVLLRKPVFEIRNPYDSPGTSQGDGSNSISRLFNNDVRTSPRMAPSIFGAGLLEAISKSDILALADPDDQDGDGISGRINWVFDPIQELRQEPLTSAIGRFGLKAGTPSVHVQGAGAYNNDMGVTNFVFPTESIAGTALYNTYTLLNPADNGQADTGFEVAEEVVKAVSFYANTLAVPARRNVNQPVVRQGADLFQSVGCTGCHQPQYVTGPHPGVWGPGGTLPVTELENQTIFPYTDLLLHDMGEGLADGRTEHTATGNEWRTAPLWGIGLVRTVNPLAGFLHDGRARTLEEAILWHGGEAQAARNRFAALAAGNRDALIAFLQSL